MDAQLVRNIAVYALPVLFAITLHEAAHAFAARRFGDATAFVAGRMSLDPLKHIDPFGTILLPLMLYLFTPGHFVFGYAKPVPIDFGALRKPRLHSALVALAGPGANFVMALGWLLLAIATAASSGPDGFVYEVASAGVSVNLLLFAFNLVPIPPLDGGRVLTALLPPRMAYKFARIEPYGFFIVMALIFLQVLNYWVGPLYYFGQAALQLLVSPLTSFIH